MRRGVFIRFRVARGPTGYRSCGWGTPTSRRGGALTCCCLRNATGTGTVSPRTRPKRRAGHRAHRATTPRRRGSRPDGVATTHARPYDMFTSCRMHARRAHIRTRQAMATAGGNRPPPGRRARTSRTRPVWEAGPRRSDALCSALCTLYFSLADTVRAGDRRGAHVKRCARPRCTWAADADSDEASLHSEQGHTAAGGVFNTVHT